MKKKMLRFLLFVLSILVTNYVFSQKIEKPEDILQYASKDMAIWEVNKYPSALELIKKNQAKENVSTKIMKKGESFRVVGFEMENGYTWGRTVKIRREKNGKEYWLPFAFVQNRECLLPLFPKFREEFKDNIKRNHLAPEMNHDEIFVISNIPMDFAAEYSNDSTYATFKYGKGGELISYNGELCVNSTVGLGARFYYKSNLSYVLSSVETNDSSIVNRQINSAKYEDKNISIVWYVMGKQIGFNLKNLSGSSIKLQWDDMSYIKYDKSNRVIHGGIRYNDMNLPQLSTVVANNASYNDILMPTCNIRYNNYAKKWEGDDIDMMLYPSPKDPKNISFLEKSTFKILFPIEINGTRFEYVFTLIVDKVDFELQIGNYDERMNL